MTHDIRNAKCGVFRALGLIAAVLWIAGGTLFFLLRFTSAFYLANKDAIDAFVGRFSR
jgi:hypothetical protein